MSNEVIDAEVIERETAITAPMGGDLATCSPDEIERRVKGIEQAANAHKRMIAAGLHLCHEGDWQAFGAKLHLNASGAQRLLALGVKLSSPLFDVKVEGEDVIVDCVLEATWPAFGKTMTDVGSCSTRDKFYYSPDPNSRTQFAKCLEQAEGNRELAMQMLTGDVKKKAFANAQGRVVSGILGIRDLTLQQLREAGLGTGKIEAGAVNFRKNATTETRQEAKDQKQFVPMEGLGGLGNGSIVETTGTLIGVQQKTKPKDGKHYYKLQFADGPEMTYWGETVDFAEGSSLVIEVKVGEYQGNKQFQANHIEAAEPQGE